MTQPVVRNVTGRKQSTHEAHTMKQNTRMYRIIVELEHTLKPTSVTTRCVLWLRVFVVMPMLVCSIRRPSRASHESACENKTHEILKLGILTFCNARNTHTSCIAPYRFSRVPSYRYRCELCAHEFLEEKHARTVYNDKIDDSNIEARIQLS